MEAFELNWALVKRVARKPPRVILHRLAQMALARWRRRAAPGAPAGWRPERLLAWAGTSDVNTLWDRLLSAPWPGQGGAEAVTRTLPEAGAWVRAAAARAARHEVAFLGSGPVRLGSPIPWHTDFKSGFTWTPRYCHDIAYADLGKPNDVKVPWELSRFQWALPLAQAHALSGDPEPAEAFAALLDDWIPANPYALSVNWACTMDVALRAMSWIWGLWLTAGAPCWTTERKARVLSALYGHGHFIQRNLEVSDVNGNHYLSDAAGLVYLGLFFQEVGEAPKWLATGRRILEQELFRQTYADGVDHEASIPYHRLVLELFAHPFLFMEDRGLLLAPAVKARVRQMAAFTAAYSGPDGRSPRFGDADDGRALAFGDQPLEDHRYLCHLVGAWLGDEALLAAAGRPWAEALWALGPRALREPWPAPLPPRSHLFPEGGLAVLANARFHLVVEAGPVGLRGRGGHGHNDATTFELWAAGERLVVDRGAWVYTADAEGRNRFRATASHSVIQVGTEEMNRFLDPLNLWQLRDDAQAQITAFEATPEGGHVAATHQGFARLGVTLSRAWALTPEALELEDRVGGADPQALTARWWLEAGVTAEPEGPQALRLTSPTGRSHRVTWNDAAWVLSIEPTTLSPSYGVQVPSQVLVWRHPGAPDLAVRWRVAPC